jgi:predicted nucleotidyltransferase
MNRFLLKIQVLVLFLLLKIPDLYSQTFVEQTDILLPGVEYSSVAWGDFDNDGYIDIIITGWGQEGRISKVYRNNANNTFSEQTGISMIGISVGSVDWSDYDNDGDLDILLTGSGISKVYCNNGENSFTEQNGIILDGVDWSSVAWGDYDNDGDLDILITGLSNLGRISKIYCNNGEDSFTEQNGIILDGVDWSSVAWGDYDNDGDQDILLTGLFGNYKISKIYRNNVDNTFTEQEEVKLIEVYNGSAAWGDYDNDGDLDILLTGETNSGDTSVVYRNNNDNSFTLQTSINLQGVSHSSAAWGDYDNDGDLDILLTGSGISRIYQNNGDNTFSWQEDIVLSGVESGSAAWGDYDNDGDMDILLSGSGVTKIYRNELSNPNIKAEIPSNLNAVTNDNTVTFTWDKSFDTETPQDGLTYNLYIYESGQSGYKCPPHAFRESDEKNGERLIARLGKIQWRPEGYSIKDLPPEKTYYWTVQAIDAGLQGGNFSEEQIFTVPFYRPVTQASCISFSDIQATQVTATWSHGGGTKRVVFIKDTVTGMADPIDSVTYNVNDLTPNGWKCVYNGTSNSVIICGLVPNTNFSLHVCEYNGTSGSENYLKSPAYQNPSQINTIFTEQTGIFLPGVYRGSVDWGDYNNDGYLDLLLTGDISGSKIFKNNGDNTFSEQTNIELTGVYSGSSAWGDYDNDGDLDILLTGGDYSEYFSKIYRNNGNNSFTEQTQVSLPGVIESSALWGDFDNDGDLDIILQGFTGGSPTRILKLYRNDSDGGFTEQTNAISANDPSGRVAVGDYDNDNDLDVLLTGSIDNVSRMSVSRIYRNDGVFSFNQLSDIVLEYVYLGSAAWGDYDNDGDLDILLAGSGISKIYKNNGNNTFSEQTGIVLAEVEYGSAAWGDYDNDGDLDILLTGSGISKIYKNENNNTFSEQNGIILTGVKESSAAWADYDNDGDLDIVLTGQTNFGNISKIYRNEILNNNIKPSTPAGLNSTWENDHVVFRWDKSSDNTTPEQGITYNLRFGTTPGGNEIKSGQALADGKLLFTNSSYLIHDTCFSIKLPCGKYYWTVQAVDKGEMAGNFAEEQITSSDSIQAKDLQAFIKTSNSLFIRWKNGNGIRRILFARISSPTGIAIPVNGTIYHAEPYFGNGDKIGTTDWFCVFNGQADSTTIYGLGEGYSYDIQAIEYIEINGLPLYFRTVGNGNPGTFSSTLFSELSSSIRPNTYPSFVTWGDYDNDGDLDILHTGSIGFYSGNFISNVYRNNGDGSFEEQTGISLTGVQYGSGAWGDYDNDDDLDILLTGEASTGLISTIYRNNGDNTFTEQINVSLPGICRSSAVWGDYDNDGNLDILLTGTTDPIDYNPISKIYRNNGDGTFNEQTSIELPGIFGGSADWGDFNNDGYLDILLAGDTGSGWISKVFSNNGDNTFVEQNVIVTNEGFLNTPSLWIDYDNDNYLDICLGGSIKTIIYRNNGDNSFTEQTNISLSGVNEGSISPGDFDNNGYLDILISAYWVISKIYNNNGNSTFTELTGLSLSGLSSMWGDYDNDGDLDLLIDSKIYRNNIIMKAGDYLANKKPAAPEKLYSVSQPAGIKLSWAPVKTDETYYKALTYNVRIGSGYGKSDILSSQSDSSSGFRRIVKMGNAFTDTSFVIKNLLSGKYYWSVQAVDQGYMGGAWSAVDSFVVKNTQSFFSSDIVCQGSATHFTDQSVVTDGIASWKWDFNDGTTSSSQNPVHTYLASGTYLVKLIITSTADDKDSLEQDVIVKPRPATSFMAPNVCEGTITAITNNTNLNGLTIGSWDWDFGDGNYSVLQNPVSHTYSLKGSYNINLLVNATNGCSDNLTKEVLVAGYPNAAVSVNGKTTFCQGDSVQLIAEYNPLYTYQWKLDDNDLINTDTSSYYVKINSGAYSVKVTNTRANCVATSGQTIVTVNPGPVSPYITNIGALEFCQGDSVELSVTNTLNYTYQWKKDGGAVGTDTSRFTAKNNGKYTLTVTNENGCSVSSADSVEVTVNPAPSAGNISLDGKGTFCEGGSVILSVPATAGYTYNWRNEYGLISGAETNSYTATTSGTYQLEVSNSKGCMARTSPVNITVKPSPEKPVLEATNYTDGVCPGEDPIRLSAGLAVPVYRYLWYKDGQPQYNDTLQYLELYEKGFYKLKAAVGECSSESEIFTINLPDGPEKPIIYVRGPTVWYLVCSNNTANEYRWYCNGELIEGAKSYFYVAGSKVGLYQVSISNAQGCFTRSDVYAVPEGYTGIDDVDPFKGLSIYPNPTTGTFTIEIDDNIFGEVNIDIISEHGKAIRNLRSEKATEHYRTVIDLSSQPKGLYFINLKIDNYLATRKVILE